MTYNHRFYILMELEIMLTEKQQEFFMNFYRSLYGEPKDKDGNPCIPHCKKSEEAKHEQLWREMVKEMLGKDCKKKYTHRGGRTETWEELVFNRLYYNYSPYFDLPDDEVLSNEEIQNDNPKQ